MKSSSRLINQKINLKLSYSTPKHNVLHLNYPPLPFRARTLTELSVELFFLPKYHFDYICKLKQIY